MKTSKVSVGLTLALLSFGLSGGFAQNFDFARNRVELRFAYTLQRPFATSSVSSLMYVRQEYRLRHGLSIGLRYYPLNHWFAEYQLGFSPEGGGYRQQFTNADYLKNSFLIGYSSSHSRSLIVDAFTGLEYNTLLGARLKNTVDGQSESVSEYFRKTHWSVPLGIGLKTCVGNNLLVGVQSFVSVSQNVSAEPSARSTQFILPAVRFTMSTFLK